jgi:Flp pilus assembly protein CpaB
MNTGTANQKGMERAMIIILTLILVGILGAYIYFGMKHAQAPAVTDTIVPTTETAPVAVDPALLDPEAALEANPIGDATATSEAVPSVEERKQILEQLETTTPVEPETRGASNSATPAPTPEPTITSDERARILEQLGVMPSPDPE